MAGEVPYAENGRFYSNSELTVWRSFSAEKGRVDKRRRNDMAKRLSIYRDDWQDILLNRLRTQFTTENYAEIIKVVDLSNNPLKRIIDEQSNVYTEPPTWTFDGADTGKQWGEILDGLKHKIVFPEINRLTNLCNECFVFVAPCDKGLTLHLITPDNLVVWQDPDDPTKPIAVAYRQSFADTPNAKPRWHYWSAGANPLHEIVEGDEWEPGKNRILLEEANPYVNEDGEAVLPGLMYHRRPPHDGIWDATGGDDLYEITLLVGCLETWINHLLRTDSLALKYVTGELDSRGGGVGSALSILQIVGTNGNPVNVGQFTSQADWKGLGDQVARKLGNALANNGLSMADFQMTGDPASGFSLRVRKEGLVERRERQLPVYESQDLALYGVIAAVWNFEITNQQSDLSGPALPWPSKAKPKIKYAEFQTTLTVQERTEEMTLMQERLSMGLISIVDVYRADHPELSEKEAEAAIVANLALNKKLQPPQELVAGRAQVLPSDANGQPVPPPGAPGAASSTPAPAAHSPLHQAIADLLAKKAAAKGGKPNG